MTNTIQLGDRHYRLMTFERDGQWSAWAVNTDTGEEFGIPCTGATADEAAARLKDWLEWQHEHAGALEALQRAEHAYHRAVAGGAFAGPSEGPAAVAQQNASLAEVETARVTLDDIRARKPASR